LTVPEKKFRRDQIMDALRALGEELSRRGVRGEIFIVGGAAMAIAYSDRRVTKDIDAVFEPKSVVYEAVAVVARDRNLPDDWVNDAMKTFLPGDDRNARPIIEFPGIAVSVASPEYLLAMKMLATRPREDEEDIKILLRECGITTAAEALALLERMYPDQELPLRAKFFLEQTLGPIER
jgi:predicted nucleotidyltransferase